MRAALVPESGDPIELGQDITLIGRRSDICDLILDETSISKMHCLLVKTEGLLYVRDLGSTNGTSVNGQRITRGALLPGDKISFAKKIYKVHLGPDDQSIPEFTREHAVKAHESAHGEIPPVEPARPKRKKPASSSGEAIPVVAEDLEEFEDLDPLDDELLDLDADDPEQTTSSKEGRKASGDPFLTPDEVDGSYEDLR
ncbi:MAG: FHA domain-containing protein [Planctomycetota bacterium]